MPRSPLRADVSPGMRAGVAFGLTTPAEGRGKPEGREVAAFLSSAFGPRTLAIIHYGSRAQSAGAQPESAHDFFVIVDRYRDAYESLAKTAGTSFSPRTAAALARVLPPNLIAVRVPQHSVHAKCAVLTLRDLVRFCSPRAKDHFTQGRLFQQVRVVWSRDGASRDAVIDALIQARLGTFRWVRPYLPESFTVEHYGRTLLETSYAGEIRPESTDRITSLLAAQKEVLSSVYGALLRALARDGVLEPVGADGTVYRQVSLPTALESFRVRLYFRRSKIRATLRWLKYVALYDDWLGYIVSKIERRSGMTVELTPRERRWPLLFLWPKVIRYLRTRPQRQGSR